MTGWIATFLSILFCAACRVTVHCLGTFGTPVGSSGSQEGDGPAAMQTDEAAAAGTAGAGDAAAAEGSASGDGSSSDGGSSSSGSGVYALDEAAVCLHFARSLLASQQDWELYDFEAAWQHAVPEVSVAFGWVCMPPTGGSHDFEAAWQHAVPEVSSLRVHRRCGLQCKQCVELHP